MIDIDLINFIKEKFPKSTIEIRESLELLESSVEATIDDIEEKSSDLVKKERNFAESNAYRVKSQSLYNISDKIRDYIELMELEEPPQEETIEINEETEKVKQLPNYNEYLVDSNVEHSLYEDFTHKRPASFEFNHKKIEVKDWKEMLMGTCEILTDINEDIIMTFPNNPKLNGKKAVYFSKVIDETMRSPRKLINLDMYVATNHSANQIRNIIINMLKQYNIPLSQYKIYLKADYSELH